MTERAIILHPQLPLCAITVAPGRNQFTTNDSTGSVGSIQRGLLFPCDKFIIFFDQSPCFSTPEEQRELF